jgi:hypothetical protein
MAAGFQIVDHLCLLEPRHMRQSLDLDNHRVIANQIASVRRGEFVPFVLDRKLNL